MTASTLYQIAFAIYAVGVTLFLIMDRRSPQSTFAWLLFLLAFPGLSLIVYILFGRTWRAFSRANEYVRRDIGDQVRDLLTPSTPSALTVRRRLVDAGHPIYARIAQLGARNAYAAVTLNNRAVVFQEPADKYARFWEDVRAAREFIHLEYFSWATDPYMRKFDGLLFDKVKQGVEVRLLYDAVGSVLLLKPSHRKALRAGGIEVEPFSPILRLHTISYRNHRKIAVFDGRVAYIGGMNMGVEHLEGVGKWKAWRDTHVRLEGESARTLSAAFLVDWYHATRRTLLDAKYAPPVDESFEALPIQIISSGPDSKYEAIRQMYFLMVTSARKYVYIQSPFFVLEQSMAEGLKSAAMSGVDVRIMLAPHGAGDNPLPYWAAYTYMLDMAGTGVKIYLYRAGYMHSKTVSVDGLVCSIGSANMDLRSFNVDYEINALIYDPTIAHALDLRFREDLRHCEIFDPEAYARKNFAVRLRDASSRLLSPLL